MDKSEFLLFPTIDPNADKKIQLRQPSPNLAMPSPKANDGRGKREEKDQKKKGEERRKEYQKKKRKKLKIVKNEKCLPVRPFFEIMKVLHVLIKKMRAF